jgi:alpha-beta hydrolase superfamily lysophospholipase
MRNRRGRALGSGVVALTVALALVGVGGSLAQNPKGKAANKARGNPKAPAIPAKRKDVQAAGDAFGQANRGPLEWPYHYKFKLNSFDNTPLAAFYYPARPGTEAPVVLLVHEKYRSGKDFEDPIEDLKNQGLAEHLQEQGYAVMVLDLRGHGANPRRELGPKDAEGLVLDLQAAYQFLLDRHNRDELDLSKFGVVALGEGANVAATWAAQPGAAVSSEGRLSDLGALVLISPTADGFHLGVKTPVLALAPRVPLLLVAGERDAASIDPVNAVKPFITRQRQNKVELFSTSLHGYKLLRFQPNVPALVIRFLDATIKSKRDEWEPRYNLTPIAYGNPEIVRRKDATKKAAAKKKDAVPDGAAKKAPARAADEAPAEKKDAGKKAAKKADQDKPADEP